LSARAAALVAAVAAGLLAGCLHASPHGPSAVEVLRCLHPYPCGGGAEWPLGLKGPFGVGHRFQHLDIPMGDGVVLDGGVAFPDTPAGVRLPTVLLLTPYVGSQNEPGDSPGILDYTFDAPVQRLVSEGYAFATVSVRGTANSGGCFGFFQVAEQHDAPRVVEFLANQSWSNGRIAGMGVSYPATEALMEAIADPPHLDTVIVGGTHGDPYLRVATPQGATNTLFATADSTPEFPLLTSYTPPPTSSDPEYATVQHLRPAIAHACAGPDAGRSEAAGQFGDDRDAAYWDAVRLQDHFANVTAAAWYVQGYADRGLAFTDDLAWPALTHAPKRILTGLWDHELPDGGRLYPDQKVADFNDRLIAWLDYWLKGIGDAPPGVGTVDFQDGATGWHHWTGWPPPGSRREALYLTADGATPAPGDSAAAFLDAPRPGAAPQALVADDVADGSSLLCDDASGVATRDVFWATAANDTLLAGDPYAYVGLTSDQPSGLLTVTLLDVAPGFACDATVVHDSPFVRFMGFGAADLRFHAGNFVAKPFPVGAETWVRVDVHGIAEPVTAGHRLAVVFGHGDWTQRHAQPTAPPATFRLSGDSFVDLQVVSGGFGGSPPTVQAPPRPFSPPS